jgi:hypothetical protein
MLICITETERHAHTRRRESYQASEVGAVKKVCCEYSEWAGRAGRTGMRGVSLRVLTGVG